MKTDFESLKALDSSLKEDFNAIYSGINNIRRKLLALSDGKTLKGDEIVGWYGEICCRELTGGRLVSDNLEYDVLASDGSRISVKTRKGGGSGWQTTSAIPKIDIDENSPTHLMFIHLSDVYSIKEIWLYKWEDLYNANRFTNHIVRGNRRSFLFRVNPDQDYRYLIYPKR